MHPASRASVSLLEWGGRKEALPESSQAFEVTEAELMDYSTCSPSSNLFSECEHLFIDNMIVFTEPAVSRAWLLLRRGCEPDPSNKQCMLNKIVLFFFFFFVLDSYRVFLKYTRRSDRKALLTGWLFKRYGLIYLIIYLMATFYISRYHRRCYSWCGGTTEGCYC